MRRPIRIFPTHMAILSIESYLPKILLCSNSSVASCSKQNFILATTSSQLDFLLKKCYNFKKRHF
nr:MAG TPA: hypothetical protein [Caudoviricetes sp.]